MDLSPVTQGPAPRVIPGLRAPANPLDPAVRRIWSAEILMTGVPIAVVATIAGALAGNAIDVARSLLLIPGVVILLATLVAAVVVPPLQYRHYRWEITGAGLIVQRGWLLREFIAVPHARIQTVETRRGPLERMVNLASAGISTAAGEAVRVPGLSVGTASALQAELSARTGQGEGA